MTDLHQWKEKILTKLQSLAFTDGSHDIDHFKRVAHRALHFNEKENLGGDTLVILAAGLLHDMVEVPKDSPNRSKASRMAADAAVQLLESMQFPSHLLPGVHHAIAAHSYTAQIAPVTVEAKCIQDADRIEALGAMGILRCFYTGGRMNIGLLDLKDPLAKNRRFDDRSWSLDHFEVKLFRIPDLMQTGEGKARAESLRRFMEMYREKLIDGGTASPEYYLAQVCAQLGRDSLTDGESVSMIDGILTNQNISREISYFVEQLQNELIGN